jgi:hypothetical protein
MVQLRVDHKAGVGDWKHFPATGVDEIIRASEDWRTAVAGISKPWLCWCVNDEWCHLQQKLVLACGWTPIVGTDGRWKNPTLVSGAVFVDFNQRLKLPVMWMHFPLEFAFLYTDILAFWHSDVLPPLSTLSAVAGEFETIQPGQYIGVRDNPTWARRLDRFQKYVLGRRNWRGVRIVNARRWFEVVGCTTREASRSQYSNGCGWWRHIECHPNAPDFIKQGHPHYDHGVGIYWWETYFAGKAFELATDIAPFHYTTKGTRRIPDKLTGEQKGAALQQHHDLAAIKATLGLDR